MRSISKLQKLSSDASSSHRWKHDVFLSFRGDDTRRGFTDHLYNTLKQKGVDTFRDDEKLERGKDINLELLRSIEESRFAVVIFSRRYACSKWCLDELQKIAECMKNMGQIVLPVFYGVHPSQVRKQGGDFRAAFDKHEQDFKENMEKVNKWRQALTEVANIAGWDLTNRIQLTMEDHSISFFLIWLEFLSGAANGVIMVLPLRSSYLRKIILVRGKGLPSFLLLKLKSKITFIKVWNYKKLSVFFTPTKGGIFHYCPTSKCSRLDHLEFVATFHVEGLKKNKT